MDRINRTARGRRQMRGLAVLVAAFALGCGGRENAKESTPPGSTNRHAAPLRGTASTEYEVDAPGLEFLFRRPDAEGRPVGSGAACDRSRSAPASGECERGSSSCCDDSPAHCE